MWGEERLKTLRIFSQEIKTSNRILFQSLFNTQLCRKGHRLVLQRQGSNKNQIVIKAQKVSQSKPINDGSIAPEHHRCSDGYVKEIQALKILTL